MTYTVQVKVMPLKELLDPQGKAVMGGLENLGIKEVAVAGGGVKRKCCTTLGRKFLSKLYSIFYFRVVF